MPECIPLCVLLINKLKYVKTQKELRYVLTQKMIKVNGVVRTDKDFPLGVMDVLTIDSANESYRLLYNNNRNFILTKIDADEARFRLDVVVRKKLGKRGVPFIFTNTGSTFRYCDPAIKIKDTVKIDIKTGSIVEYLPFAHDMRAFVVRGKNMGCVGTIKNIEKHDAGNDIAYIIDTNGRGFNTRADNVFVIGDSNELLIKLPKGDGIKLSELEKSNLRFGGVEKEEKLNENEVVIE